MGTKSTGRDQAIQLMGVLGCNVNWDELPSDVAKRIIDDPVGSGLELTRFLQNGGKMQASYLRNTGELTVNIPALPRPTLAQLQAKHAWIKSIERDASPSEAVTMNLATVLRPEETEAIDGAEYEQRLAPHLNDLLGFQQLEWLVEHQDEHPIFMALLGKIYVDGPGLVVAGEDGGRRIPCLFQDGRRWKLCWDYLDGGFSGDGRVAFSSK